MRSPLWDPDPGERYVDTRRHEDDWYGEQLCRACGESWAYDEGGEPHCVGDCPDAYHLCRACGLATPTVDHDCEETGEKLQELRRAAGLSREALGERLGVSWKTIERYEHDGGPILQGLRIRAIGERLITWMRQQEIMSS